MNVRRALSALSLTTLAVVSTALFTGTTASAAESGETVYTGTATITVGTYDYCDFSNGQQRRPVGQQSITAPVTLVVSDPVSDPDGGAEAGGLHFSLQTDDQTSPGAFSLLSGTVLTTPDTGRRLTVSYWTAGLDDGRVSGTLTDDHREEAAAANLLGVAQPLVPCRTELGTIPMVSSLAEGAQLEGTLDGSGAEIEVAGTTYDGLYDLHVTTSLSRTG